MININVKRFLLWLGLLIALVAAVLVTHPVHADEVTAKVTYYDLLGTMANGDQVHDGAAACPKAFMGAVVRIVRIDRWYICADTGADWYFNYGVFKLDVWAPVRPWWMVYDYEVIEVYWW